MVSQTSICSISRPKDFLGKFFAACVEKKADAKPENASPFLPLPPKQHTSRDGQNG